MKTRRLWAAAGIMIMGFTGQALAYSQAPSWSPMTMPGITYDAATNALAIQTATTPATPKLLNTNTLSNGNASTTGFANFDPATPWGKVAQGTAFSRQLGWFDATRPKPDPKDPNNGGQLALGTIYTTLKADLNNPDARIWIQEVEASPGLNTYYTPGLFGMGGDAYAGYLYTADNTTTSAPIDYSDPSKYPGAPYYVSNANIYKGIFGTDGSPLIWEWDGRMDHNINTFEWNYFSTPNELLHAKYRLYVGDATGVELVDANGNPLVTPTTTIWYWQTPATVPAPEPSTFILVGAGLASLVALKRRRR